MSESLSPWIHTTDACNLKCSYCHVKGQETMSEKTYLALEKYLCSLQVDKLSLRIAGGEPLLVFNNWLNFANKMLTHENVSIEILTNLTIIPTGFLELTKKEKVNVSVSIDSLNGNKGITSEKIEILSELTTPWIMTTLTEENLLDMEKLATFIGEKNYGWAISTDYFWDDTFCSSSIIIAMLKSLNILKSKGYNFDNFSFNNLSISKKLSGCTAGNTMFSIYSDGGIYRCQTQHNNLKARIGDIYKGYKKTKPTNKSKTCSRCSINAFCAGWCPLHHTPGNKICKVMKFVTYKLWEELSNA